MTHRFGIALVGIGPGAVPHLQSLFDLRDTVELRHAVTRRPALANLGPFHGQLTPSADLQAALADPLVQAVIVATPPASHLELATQVFAAGKHLLLEKPLDISLTRAQAIVDLAQASDRRFVQPHQSLKVAELHLVRVLHLGQQRVTHNRFVPCRLAGHAGAPGAQHRQLQAAFCADQAVGTFPGVAKGRVLAAALLDGPG
ncbi:MAG: gfo/Idh/MocA family oxidoreductase [Betaproteobacteria bacterium]|nr:gfo/Idh/MocA family oxidoreductase [Betaproteobacteria bacterium]